MKIKSLEHLTEADFTRIVISLYPLVEAAAMAYEQPSRMVLCGEGYFPHPEALEEIGKKAMSLFEEEEDG